ncbi:hypothetical protein ACFQX6_67550 [Streptosporangium lutulentum]
MVGDEGVQGGVAVGELGASDPRRASRVPCWSPISRSPAALSASSTGALTAMVWSGEAMTEPSGAV